MGIIAVASRAWGLVAVSLRQLVRSVACALHPEAESRLVDLMLSQRRLQVGPRVVAIGGGTGLSTLLRGLKQPHNEHHRDRDSGRRWRQFRAVADGYERAAAGRYPQLPRRACRLRAADDRACSSTASTASPGGLGGHNFGNLLIAALTDITGDFEQAIRETSRVLAIRGRVLPPTADARGALRQDGRW
jgi:2-phospho-L-lactate transferase/gluconeogenesis factor (CofD/UPF0052 family)